MRLSSLKFADDIILFAKSESELEKLLAELNVEEKKDRMKLNGRKRIMCYETCGRGVRKSTALENEILEDVE